jgi:hypothetical protein
VVGSASALVKAIEVAGAKKKIIAFVVVICAGAALVVCGAAFNSKLVLTTDDEGCEDTLRKSEFDVIRDVTVGGLERQEGGMLKQTYAPGKAPAACPT